MNIVNTQQSIEKLFRNSVQKDRKVHNAYLSVHSDKLDIHINIAEGSSNNIPANENQPYYIASVGKLFTSEPSLRPGPIGLCPLATSALKPALNMTIY